MAGRNRMDYRREHPDYGREHAEYVPYREYGYGNSQFGPSREMGMGERDFGRGRRDQGPRRIPKHHYIADPREFSARGQGMGGGDVRVVSGGRGFPEPPPLHNQQILNSSFNHLPYDQGPMGPGGVGSHMRGVGMNNYGNADNYGMLQQQQGQLVDRNMYSVSELGGSLPSEVGGFRSGYVGSEDSKLVLGAAQTQKLQQQGGYPGRQVLRDGRPLYVGGREDSLPMITLSPRVSPRRDDFARMMSPRRDDLSPPPMSPRRDDIPHMMSPRRDDIPHMMSPRRDDVPPQMMSPRREDFTPPPRSPKRREYPTLDYGRRLQQRRGLSPSREEDFIMQQRQDFPMSPRREAPITPPMSPLREEFYYDLPAVSPPRRSGPPMSPRHITPTRSPMWGRTRQGAKPPSQWDVLPVKSNVWTPPGEREFRRDNRYVGDRWRGHEGYGIEIDDPKRLGHDWPPSRRGEGQFARVGNEDDFRGPPFVGRNYTEPHPSLYGMANSRPYAYNSVVNQRVGLVTKYIERERAERAAKDATERAAREAIRRKASLDDRHAVADHSKPSHNIRQNERDTLAAAIAKTSARFGRKESSSGKKLSKYDKSTGAAAAASGKLLPAASNPNKTDAGDKTNEMKPSNANNAVVTTVNETAEVGSSGQLKSLDVKGAEAGNEAATADVHKTNNVVGGSGIKNGRHTNGPPSKPVLPPTNGNANSGPKPGGEEQRDPSLKRPSLVMEIERVKKSRKITEQQNHHVNIEEVEETYYDANELSADFVSKVNKAGNRYSRMLTDDQYLKRRYQGGGQGGLLCLVCGKASKIFSDASELVIHAQHSQVQSKRIDHMGFRKALIDVLKLDVKDHPPVSTIKADDDMIVWPPTVVVENTRTGLGADNRWEGLTNSEMTLLLNELGHPHGRAKSIWDKFGHRGIVHIEFDPCMEGLQYAEGLHKYFMQSGCGRIQWEIIRPLKTGLPGSESVPEGQDFSRFDEVTKTNQRVLYGYIALKKDIDKNFSRKQKRRIKVVNQKEIKAELLQHQAGEQVLQL